MAVIVTVEIPGGTREVYERTTEKITSAPWWPAKGFLAHAAGPDGTGGWRVVDFWESEADFMAFAEKAAPIFQEEGMSQAAPRVEEAVNVILK
ncbi:hypothetical protein ACFY8W_12030 [Streptomyces sp. NPDC012637]|uniref:hypothetical protein n=1 Tax=Streptomyces sp. NPDC012637 TaxID=3364842 RepID=UPI0036EC0B1C